MKRKIYLMTTTIVQAVYLLWIAFGFFGIWLVTIGAPYPASFAIFGLFLIELCPTGMVCFIVNLIFWIKDIKKSHKRSEIVISGIIIFASLILLCLAKLGLSHYGNTLTPIV